jgi:hypothetical protein
MSYYDIFNYPLGRKFVFDTRSPAFKWFWIRKFCTSVCRNKTFPNLSRGRVHSLDVKTKKTKLHGLSPRANYTDRATAACRRSDCQLMRIEGATWSAWRIPSAVFSRFSGQEPLLFYQVAPQLYSRGWVDPVPDPLLFFSGTAGNRIRASGSVAKNSDH